MENNNFQAVCHYQFENGSSQFAFLDGANIIDHSKSFFTENFLQTLASSNGLILLSGYTEDQPCYYVFNPLTKESFTIPQVSIVGRVVRVGLANDGSQFQVVMIVEAGSSESNGLELHIFSSDTAMWRRHIPVNLTLPSLPEFEFQELGIPPLYSNGAIHWEIGGYLLVYKVQGSNCELYELPNFFNDWSWQLTMTYRRCLSESGGRVYYCYADFDGLHIWELLNEHDHHHLSLYYACYDSKRFRWRLENSVMHEIFMSMYQSFYGSFNDWEPYKIAPVAYNEQAQNIYLQIPGSFVSYNFDTRNMRTICTYSYPGVNFNCCTFFALTTPGISKEQKEKDMLAIGEKELNLPIAELEKLAL